jgi:hypothetical protein
MAMYSFVPPIREATFCGVLSCVFDKLGRVTGGGGGCGTLDYFIHMLYPHRHSFQLCTCILFNYMFQNLRVELIQEQLEIDTEICMLLHSNCCLSVKHKQSSNFNEQKAILCIIIHIITVLFELHWRGSPKQQKNTEIMQRVILTIVFCSLVKATGLCALQSYNNYTFSFEHHNPHISVPTSHGMSSTRKFGNTKLTNVHLNSLNVYLYQYNTCISIHMPVLHLELTYLPLSWTAVSCPTHLPTREYEWPRDVYCSPSFCRGTWSHVTQSLT